MRFRNPLKVSPSSRTSAWYRMAPKYGSLPLRNPTLTGRLKYYKNVSIINDVAFIIITAIIYYNIEPFCIGEGSDGHDSRWLGGRCDGHLSGGRHFLGVLCDSHLWGGRSDSHLRGGRSVSQECFGSNLHRGLSDGHTDIVISGGMWRRSTSKSITISPLIHRS